MTSPVVIPAGHKLLAADFDAYENLTGSWASWTPTWSATGTAPSLGDGTLIGQYMQAGKSVVVFMRLTWGSTTTGGTGRWQFSLPVNTAFDNTSLPMLAYDTSAVQPYPCVGRTASSAINSIGAHSATGSVGQVGAGTHPFAWATGDVLVLLAPYQAA